MKTENCLFQRNFLAQTGDPTGSGRGGASIFRSLYGDQATFFEAETKPRIKHVKKGTLSMVNNGQDMHGSQVETFFGLKTRLVCFLVGQYLFPTTKLTCFYVLSLLKSLNNRIIQILNLTVKLTLKTNPNA